VNISVGESGEPLQKAMKVLEELTGQTPCKRNSKQTIREFGIRKGEPIACVVTLRKKKARDFLQKVLPVVDSRVASRCFDRHGNFSFGIDEHIEIPGVKYKPEIGIFGMDVCVSLQRPGFRVKERRKGRSKMSSRHALTPEEAMVFVKDSLGVEIS
ncbi:MAG: 50S ribosomal protein L5, partial [Candidatus Korarchaeota archaeon]|nr:50S ribosomal protein L5 [Candidatus Korarchaeota archaeon]NIU84773.1 50S ribosomal protein L5 [Candidatus Thorarchaeota archaeon]